MTTQDRSSEHSRRDFVALSTAAGVIAVMRTASGAEVQVVETAVEISTPDGTCDASFIHPASGRHPGVIIWTDTLGQVRVSRLRKADCRRRLLRARAESVLSRREVAGVQRHLDVQLLGSGEPREDQPADGIIGAAGAAEMDAAASLRGSTRSRRSIRAARSARRATAWADRWSSGPRRRCRRASAPAASFHGGGLVTANPDSPHLLAPKIKARMYFGIAANDDKSQPDAKDKLREAFAAAHVPAEIEVYGSSHGWCVPDMPAMPTARRSTTRRTPRGRGASSSRSTRRRWPRFFVACRRRRRVSSWRAFSASTTVRLRRRRAPR